MQMLTLASSRSDSRAKRSCGVVGFGEVDAATGAQHPPGFAQHRQRIDQVLHHPHQPHPVEMAIGTGKLRGVAHHELHRFASQAGQMTAGGGDLLRVEVDAAEPRFGVGLSDLAEHRAHAAADLQQVFAGMELQVVGQQIPQQIGLLHEPALFPLARAVDVAGLPGHGCRFRTRQELGTAPPTPCDKPPPAESTAPGRAAPAAAGGPARGGR